ncbi:MAG: hypothetical protein JXR07_20480 [Reichenbachiella sp.]
MDALAITNWFEDVAINLKVIGHVTDEEGKSRFARNIDELIEGLRRKTPCTELTLVMDEPYGQLQSPAPDEFQDVPVTTFMILKKVKENDWQDEDVVFDAAKKAAFKIWSKALKEKKDFYTGENLTGIMKNLSPGTFRYRKEYLRGHWLFGVHCTFSFVDPINTELVYDAADWSF